MRWRALILGLLAVSACPAAAEQVRLTVLFHVRPPYSYYGTDHRVAGLLFTPVSKALDKTGIAADWVEMPPARQVEEIKRADRAICGLGWFKRPEREAFAIFTAAVYRDRSPVVIARKDDGRFADGMSLQDSFRDSSRTLMVKTGYSYGAVIDGWIKDLQPRADTSSVDNDKLLGMIAQQRADYAIMAPEEAEDLLQAEPPLGAALHAVRPGDAPKGERRYLMCSKSTPPELIAQISASLAH